MAIPQITYTEMTAEELASQFLAIRVEFRELIEFYAQLFALGFVALLVVQWLLVRWDARRMTRMLTRPPKEPDDP